MFITILPPEAVLPIIFFFFYTLSFIFSLFSLYIQSKKIISIFRAKTNGNEKFMSVLLTTIAATNSFFLHIFIITSLDSLVSQNYRLQGRVVDIYVALALLVSAILVGTISWLLMSREAIELLSAIKITDSHDFKIKKKNAILAIWAEDGVLNTVSDFLAVYKILPESHWELIALYSDSIKFEHILRDSDPYVEISIIYIAAHCDGSQIALSDDEFIDAGQLSRLAKRKKTKLVLLGVCEGGEFAQALLMNEVEAVIFWLFPVEDKYAIQFARTFFASLSEGATILQALTNAKEMIPSHVGTGNLRALGYLGRSFVPIPI